MEIARPLLGVWREEIDAYIAAHALGAGLPAGALVVEVNIEETPLSPLAAIVLRGKAAEILPALRASLREHPRLVLEAPPGAGKTTALLNSGLKFPLIGSSGKAPVSGTGGTRFARFPGKGELKTLLKKPSVSYRIDANFTARGLRGSEVFSGETSGQIKPAEIFKFLPANPQ